MLPNFRSLITATLSTFLLTAAAGLFVSLRLAQDPLTMRSDARAAFNEGSINRVSLSWSRPDQDRAAALRELGFPENFAPADVDEQTARVNDAPLESAVAEEANSEAQIARQSEEHTEPQKVSPFGEHAEPPLAPAPPSEQVQIATRSTPESDPQATTLSAPAEIAAINGGDQALEPEADGEPAQAIHRPGAKAKVHSSPRTVRQANSKIAKYRAAQRKRAKTPRILSRQFLQLTPRAAATINTAAPFLFFGSPASP